MNFGDIPGNVRIPPEALEVVPACRLRHGAAQSVNSASATLLTWDTEDFDTAAMHDPASAARVTIPEAGIYVVAARASWSEWAGYRELRLRKNGTEQIDCDVQFGSASGTDSGSHLAALHDFDAGDFIELLAWQTSGAAKSIRSAASWTPVLTVAYVSA